jgi:hypothetical protein
MNELPLYLSILFIVCTLYTLLLFWLASGKSYRFLLISIIWLAIQAIISYSLFYTDTQSVPPKFILAIFPAIILIILVFLSKRGRKFINKINLQTLYLIHVVRIPVEFGLYGLAIYKAIPLLMTFEGVNFDIFAGITAPLIILGYFKRDWFSDSFVLIWNMLSLGLLMAIVVNAILSVESPLQTQAFDQPNIAILHFPFIWLLSYIVPVVIFSHIVAMRRAYSK